MRFDPNLDAESGPNIDHLLRANFPTEFEANLVEILRSSKRICAEHGLWDKGALAGYIAYSPVRVDGVDSKRQIWGLGPMAIDADHQRQGHGKRFLGESLDYIEVDAVVLLGHGEFYTKHGFRPAADFGLHFGDDRTRENAFFALECWKGALEGHRGRVIYEDVFYRE
ncbi:GNAT family N-acetyltransferase [Kordiimonas aestuarii]|uniref:GNAT family N-acetyltransferase n=1 Tax=Kordiimonas aestuarii TaxID=1005925 RepID=UPI0021D10FE5|nr:N-acetyltransferase [Kordiimonas aestuarii]